MSTPVRRFSHPCHAEDETHVRKALLAFDPHIVSEVVVVDGRVSFYIDTRTLPDGDAGCLDLLMRRTIETASTLHRVG